MEKIIEINSQIISETQAKFLSIKLKSSLVSLYINIHILKNTIDNHNKIIDIIDLKLDEIILFINPHMIINGNDKP